VHEGNTLTPPPQALIVIERNLPQNLDRTALKAGLRLAQLNNALEFARKASGYLNDRSNQLCAPDSSTVLALNTAIRLLRVEVEDARRLEESAARIADESHAAAH